MSTNTSIDERRLRAAAARLDALGAPEDARAAFIALIDRQDRQRATMGRVEAANDDRQMVLPFDAAEPGHE
jgi:hypothetical protein